MPDRRERVRGDLPSSQRQVEFAITADYASSVLLHHRLYATDERSAADLSRSDRGASVRLTAQSWDAPYGESVEMREL